MTPISLTLTILILVCGVAATFNRVGRHDYPQYSADKLLKSAERSRFELNELSAGVTDVIDLLIQGMVAQDDRIKRLEDLTISMNRELAESHLQQSSLRKYVSEQTAMYHGNMPFVGRPDNTLSAQAPSFFDEADRGDSINRLNMTLIGLSLTVHDLSTHLEEVEAITMSVKEESTNEFTAILNNIIPEIQRRVESQYKNTLEGHVNDTALAVINSKLLMPNRGGLHPRFNSHGPETANLLPAEGREPHTSDRKTIRESQNVVEETDQPAEPTAEVHRRRHQNGENSQDRQDRNGSKDCGACKGSTKDADRESNGRRQFENDMFIMDVDDYNRKREALAEHYRLTNCDLTLRSVSQKFELKRVNGSRNDVFGSWMKDSYREGDQVYFLQGFRRLRKLQAYSSIITFRTGIIDEQYDLPFACGGTGNILFNKTLYCIGFKSNVVYSYNLINKQVHTVKIPVKPMHNRFSYSFGGYSYMDLISDQNQIWVLYSNSNSNGNIIISKLSPDELVPEFTETIQVKQNSVMNSFMVCGDLYVVERGSDSSALEIRRVNSFKTHINLLPAVGVLLEDTPNTAMLMVDFNHASRRLYSWNLEGIQEAVMKEYHFNLYTY